VYQLSKVTVRFGERRLLDSVSVSFGPEPVALMGPSGSGKTTLIQVLAGQLRPVAGRVSLDGKPIRFSNRTVADSRIAVIHQDYRLVEFLSALDNVLLASELRGLRRSARDARELLGRVGLNKIDVDRKPGTLSGGEQQRVAIARALLCGATVLLADEPTGALDIATTMQITDLLLELAESERVQVVIATHDLAVAGRMP
jgi:ABC-type lipoprotein export system ATPase subunit